MPAYKLTFGDRVLVYDDWNGYISYQLHHNVILTQQPGGIITAEPMSGYAGEIVTLSNTPDIGYTFDSYNITGATLTGNTFAMENTDVNVSPSWNHTKYNVTVATATGGTVTASPTTGYYGTEVTLSNTPASDYKFSSYSITGATLTNNKFNIGTSNVTVKGNFTRYRQVFVNLGSKQYNGATSTVSVALTGMPSSTSFNYLTFVMDALYDNAGLAADIYFRNSSNGVMWRSRCHYNIGVGFVGITGNVTGWTTQSGQTVTSKTQDGVSYRLNGNWGKGAWKKIKLVFDRTNKRCYFYVAGVLLGYATMNADMINCKNIGLQKEVSSGTNSHIKNIRVAGFSTLADAQAYNG